MDPEKAKNEPPIEFIDSPYEELIEACDAVSDIENNIEPEAHNG